MRLLIALRLIPERVIRGLRERRIVIAHHIRHRHADALLFVVQHQHRPAIGAKTDFQRAIRVIGVERHPLHLFGVIHLHIAIVEKRDMGGVLFGHGFADIAVAFMVINRLGIGSHFAVRAAPGVCCGHNSLPEMTPAPVGAWGQDSTGLRLGNESFLVPPDVAPRI